MFGLEKIFARPSAADGKGLDKAATEMGVAIKDVPSAERGLVKKLIDDLNEFLRKDYEASL
jgi:hypothetical protein